MAYDPNPRLTEAAILDRMTGGGGLSEYDQRQLARQGIIPTQQQMINSQLNDQLLQQQQLQQQKLQNQYLKNQNTYSSWPYRNYDQLQVGTQRTTIPAPQQAAIAPSATTLQPTAGTGRQRQAAVQPQLPQQKYSIDYQAAEDAGNFLRALQGKSGRANERIQGQPDLQKARDILNKTPYSSISGATDLTLDNGILTILGPENAVLGKIPMPEVERQLSNLNNYAVQKNLISLPAQAARLGSRELGEGAAAAREAAMDPDNLQLQGYKQRRGLWQRQVIDPVTGRGLGFETFDPAKAGDEAYRQFINEYGARGEGQQTYQYDPNFNRTTTPIRLNDGTLGFNLASRYSQNPLTGADYSGRGTAGLSGSTDDIIKLAREKAGITTAPGTEKPGELPPPASTIKPKGQQGELPAPAGTQSAPTRTRQEINQEANKIRQQAEQAATTNQQGFGSVASEAGQAIAKGARYLGNEIDKNWGNYQAHIIARGRYGQDVTNDQADAMVRYYNENKKWPKTINDIPTGQSQLLPQPFYQIPANPQQTPQGIQYNPQPINDLTVEQNPQQQQQQQRLIDNLQRSYQQQRQPTAPAQPAPPATVAAPQTGPVVQPTSTGAPAYQPAPTTPQTLTTPTGQTQQQPLHMVPWFREQTTTPPPQTPEPLPEAMTSAGGPAGPSAAPEPQSASPLPAPIEYNPPENIVQPLKLLEPDWNLIESDARYGELGAIPNQDGTLSTEFSITEFIPDIGGWVNIPTMVQGQTDLNFLNTGILTPENIQVAIQRAINRTAQGAILPTYDSQQEAEEAARGRTVAEKMLPYRSR